MTRNNLVILWRLNALLLLILTVYPLRSGSLRLMIAFSWLALGAGSLFLFWRRKFVRYPLLLLGTFSVALLSLPGRRENQAALGDRYVRSLQGYEGVRYVWGGETKTGIDCSGLVRCGLMKACFREGILTFNPSLVRTGISLWWHDSSAKELKNGYGGRTRPLWASVSLNRLDYSRLQPGDVAVTMNEIHTLAYLGEKTWIEADPEAGKVLTVAVPSQSVWFSEPMQIVRWRILEDAPAERAKTVFTPLPVIS